MAVKTTEEPLCHCVRGHRKGKEDSAGTFPGASVTTFSSCLVVDPDTHASHSLPSTPTDQASLGLYFPNC